MNWKDIKISSDNKSFIFEGSRLFDKIFIEALKFHSPWLAAVKDESGCYHIDDYGKGLYKERYTRTFGYYCNRASVLDNEKSFHLTEKGGRAYQTNYLWCGNFQENICPVRDNKNKYFHIDLNGNKLYASEYIYVGDYKDGIACVKTEMGFYKHIDTKGVFINNKNFLDLGIFHKNYATARDEKGWHHIDKNGVELYEQRYLMIEPFYNGFSVVETIEKDKRIIDEYGKIIIEL